MQSIYCKIVRMCEIHREGIARYACLTVSGATRAALLPRRFVTDHVSTRQARKLMMQTLLSQAPPAYPVPPADLSAPHAWSMAFTVICVAFWALAFIWVTRLALRGDKLGLVFLVGGLCMGLLEPYLDYLGLLWFATDNVAVTVNLFARHIPLYVVLGYSFFFGLQAYVIYRAILLGKGPKFFAYAYGLSWIFDAALQITGAQFGLYRYYGQQPFLFFGAPAWWYTS